MTPTRPAVRARSTARPVTDAPSTGYGVDNSGNLESSRPAADIPATCPKTSSPPSPSMFTGSLTRFRKRFPRSRTAR